MFEADPRPRGRTRPGRLASLDRYLTLAERPLLLAHFADDAPVVDIGIGERPDTTVELAQAVHSVAPGVSVVGVDVDAQRVATARELAPDLHFTCADGLAEELPAGLVAGRARLVRAMNVLRGLSPCGARAGHLRLGRLLSPGGLLIEGTCDRSGSVLVAHLMMAMPDARLARRGLLFFTDFSRGCGPWMFRDQLPRDLRQACRVGHPVHGFLAAWHAAFVASSGQGTPPERYVASARSLPDTYLLDPEILPGLVVWRPPGGVPHG